MTLRIGLERVVNRQRIVVLDLSLRFGRLLGCNGVLLNLRIEPVAFLTSRRQTAALSPVRSELMAECIDLTSINPT